MPQIHHSIGTRKRTLKVLLLLLQYPHRFTKKQLAEKVEASTDTISNIFKDMQSVGFVLDRDPHHRYRLKEEATAYRQLSDLLLFTDEDQLLLYRAIDNISNDTVGAQRLKRKLGNLYNFQRLGHPMLKKGHLQKIDLLRKARALKCQVVLEGYQSSNSNSTRDRKVEPFHIATDEDSVHAFDIDINAIRHFRIMRIQRITVLEDQPWQFESRHYVARTDPFRIRDDEQVMVHLRMKTGARNELIERFPLTESYLQADPDERDSFYFQGPVNHRFNGLTNFILGNHHRYIDVLEPESLRIHLLEETKKIQKKLRE